MNEKRVFVSLRSRLSDFVGAGLRYVLTVAGRRCRAVGIFARTGAAKFYRAQPGTDIASLVGAKITASQQRFPTGPDWSGLRQLPTLSIFCLMIGAGPSLLAATQAVEMPREPMMTPPLPPIIFPGLPVVTITAPDSMASEAGRSSAVLVISRSGSTESQLTVALEVGGTATEGRDYETLPRSVTIPAGRRSTALLVKPIDDSLAETKETVVVKLIQTALAVNFFPRPPESGFVFRISYALAEPNTATITIVDDDEANVLPTVQIVSPTDGSKFVGPVNITFRADAADKDGTVREVEFFVGDRSLGRDTIPPYSVTWTNVPPGEYTVTARATDNAEGRTTSAPVRVFVSADGGTGGFSAKINFQPADARVPKGYQADVGQVFGPRDNGLTYGWDKDNRANTRNRNHALSPDQRYDTLAFLQRENQSFTWELAVPNGTYEVKVVAGDPTTTNIMYGISAEGFPVIHGAPTNEKRWLEGATLAKVNDGRLTVSSLPDARNNRICFIEVKGLDAANQPPKVQIAEPADKAVFLAGTDVSFRIEAADADGYITAAELFVGSKRIASERRDYLVKPPNGQSATFPLVWKDVPAGIHTITAKASDDRGLSGSSAPISILVQAAAARPTVAIYESDPEASESNPQNVGVFKVVRTGNLASKLNVRYSVSGDARNGIDYENLPGLVTIPPGEISAAIILKPYPDKALEGKESVTVTVTQLVFITRPAPEDDYLVGWPKSATVTIYEDETANVPPTVSIRSPADGATFAGVTNISLEAQASDRDGRVQTVEFFAGDRSLGLARHDSEFTLLPDLYWAKWDQPAPGTYLVTAKATDNRGATTTSKSVKITVQGSVQSAAKLTITSPANGATFFAPADLTINALAIDPAGYISHVEFYSGTNKIGDSNIAFFRAPDPGESILHTVQWRGVPAGEYKLTAVAKDTKGAPVTSAPVVIIVKARSLQSLAPTGRFLTVGEGGAAIQRLANGDVQLTGAGEAGQTYAIEASADLVNWTVAGTVTSAGPAFQFIDRAAPDQSRRFYRVRPVGLAQ